MNLITGAGWFDDATAWAKKHAEPVLKGIVKAARTGEKLLANSEFNDSLAYKALSAVDKGAAALGYGQRHSKKKGLAIRR